MASIPAHRPSPPSALARQIERVSMKFPHPLVPARLLRRYKRFLADVELADGRAVTVHCPNPGSMLGLDMPGSEVWLSPAASPGRKLPYSWELICVGRRPGRASTPAHPNALAEEAIRQDHIRELTAYERLRREVNYGVNSRIDLLCERDRRSSLLCRGQERPSQALRRRRVSGLRHRARRQAPARIDGHGRGRQSCGHALHRAACRLSPLFHRRRYRSGLTPPPSGRPMRSRRGSDLLIPAA